MWQQIGASYRNTIISGTSSFMALVSAIVTNNVATDVFNAREDIFIAREDVINAKNTIMATSKKNKTNTSYDNDSIPESYNYPRR